MKIIKYEKENCTPCSQVSQYLDSKGIEFERINPFEKPELAIKDEVFSVPVTFLVDEDGNRVKRSVGFQPTELDEMIEQL
ncbi:thiol reductase thioredoxin [Brevibacillus brevis X23]|nr:thiol reductase thioredoxin [Brevibacillus brevis X23]